MFERIASAETCATKFCLIAPHHVHCKFAWNRIHKSLGWAARRDSSVFLVLSILAPVTRGALEFFSTSVPEWSDCVLEPSCRAGACSSSMQRVRGELAKQVVRRATMWPLVSYV